MISEARSYQAPALENYFSELALGNITGRSSVRKFGRNPDIDVAAGFETIWHLGGSWLGAPVGGSAELVTLSSNDANDVDTTGTGAWTVEIYGLDSSWLEQSETIALNGATKVDSVNTYHRVYRAIVRSAGSSGSNTGRVLCQHKVTTGNIFFGIPPTYNQTMVAAYTVPAGKTALVHGCDMTLSGKVNANSTVQLLARPFGELFAVKDEFSLMAAGSSGITRLYRTPITLAAKTDVFIQADTDTNDTIVTGSFCMELIDD